MALELSVDSKALRQAFARGPDALKRRLDRAILKTVIEMARAARESAPKAHGLLVNSIRPVQVSEYEGLVTAGANYASLVEFGTKGDGRIPGKRGDSDRYQGILDWIKVGRGISPRDPDMSQEDLAYVIARSIALKGTPPKPFMKPAFEINREVAIRNINEAIKMALRDIARGALPDVIDSQEEKRER